MRRRAIRLGTLVGVVVCLASSVEADPIHVVYRVDVSRQCTFANDTETCRDFHASFPLTLTFDAQVVLSRGDDNDRVQRYGDPTVSDIPLALRNDFPPLGPSVRDAAERARFSADQKAWIREAAVIIRQIASVDRNDFHRDFSLIANGEFPFAPALSAQSFARFLATAPSRAFSLSDAVERADGGFEALSYVGQISLDVPSAPTPEPASLLLVATGITAVALRRRRSAPLSL